MEHIIILFYILTFTVGFGAIFLFLFFSFKIQNKRLKKYTIFLFLFTGYVVLNFISLYALNYFQIENPLFYYILSMLYSGLFIAFILIIPKFLFSLLNIKTDTIKILSVIIACITTVALFVILFVSSGIELIYARTKLILYFAETPIVFLFMLSLIIGYFVQRKKIEQVYIRLYIKKAIILLGCFLPFFLFDVFFVKLQIKNHVIPYGFMFLVLFYLIWNILSIIYLFRYFREEFKELPLDKIPSELIEKFKLTKRETEVALLYANGHDRKEISEKMFISYATVKMHLLHIYNKLDVKSKEDLNEKIRSYL